MFRGHARGSSEGQWFTWLEQVTAANDVVVCTTSYGCDSIRTKALFEQDEYRDLDVKCYDLDTLPFGKALLSILPPTPTIYIKQKLLGTLGDLELAMQRGEFSAILEAAQ